MKSYGVPPCAGAASSGATGEAAAGGTVTVCARGDNPRVCNEAGDRWDLDEFARRYQLKVGEPLPVSRPTSAIALLATGAAVGGIGFFMFLGGLAAGDPDCKKPEHCVWAVGLTFMALSVPELVLGTMGIKKRVLARGTLDGAVERYNGAAPTAWLRLGPGNIGLAGTF
jgi:hypothetical protein